MRVRLALLERARPRPCNSASSSAGLCPMRRSRRSTAAAQDCRHAGGYAYALSWGALVRGGGRLCLLPTRLSQAGPRSGISSLEERAERGRPARRAPTDSLPRRSNSQASLTSRQGSAIHIASFVPAPTQRGGLRSDLGDELGAGSVSRQFAPRRRGSHERARYRVERHDRRRGQGWRALSVPAPNPPRGRPRISDHDLEQLERRR